MKIVTSTHVATTLLQLSKHLHHHRHGDLADLTSRSEVVGDGDDSGDDAGAPWFMQKQNINKNIIILILGLSENPKSKYKQKPTFTKNLLIQIF